MVKIIVEVPLNTHTSNIYDYELYPKTQFIPNFNIQELKNICLNKHTNTDKIRESTKFS